MTKEQTLPEQTKPTIWTSAPERCYKDLVSPDTSQDMEHIRNVFLQIGLPALNEPERLVLPPLKGYASKRAGGRKDLHCHRYVEVGVVTRGEMIVWWEGVTSLCRRGTVFVIPPGMRYLPHVLVPGEATSSHSVLWLALHGGNAVCHLCSLEAGTHLLSEYYCFSETRVAGQARIMAQELAERGPLHALVIRGSLLCLLTWLLRAPVYSISRLRSTVSHQSEADQDPFQRRVEAYLLSHYHRPLSLAQVARSVECSPAYLCRRFRELSGQTPFHFLREVRIEAAKRLLHSDIPVSRVAEMVGFDDPLYFSKVFTRQAGEAPQQFRARRR